jgi:hypothetical protein
MIDNFSAAPSDRGLAFTVKRRSEGFERLQVVKTANVHWVTGLACLLSIALCFILVGCVASNLAMEAQVQRYSGDGVIHSCSTALMAGYRIQFPKFDASRAYAASYRLSHVPQMHRIDGRDNPSVYLRFRSSLGFAATQEFRKTSTAIFRLTLVDSRGKVIYSTKSTVSDSRWGQQARNLYDSFGCEFHFERDATYVLKVAYTPGTVPPPAKELYFVLENCGYY